MLGLLGDGWFYVSAAGFIISAVFFVFLLGQYRAAVEAEDDVPESEAETEALAKPAGLEPSLAPKIYTPTVAPVAEKPAAKVEPVVAPLPVAEKKAPVAAKENTTGGLSPAVVYLQNMKVQMERLDKEISGLKAVAAQQSTHTDLILKKLGELSEKISGVADVQRAIAEGAFTASASAPSQPASGNPLPPAASAPAAGIVLPAPPPAPEPIPEPEPLKTLDLSEPPPRAPEPVVEAPAPKVEEKKVAKVDPDKTTPIPENAAADKTLVIEPTVKPVKLGSADIPLPARPGMEPAKADAANAPTIELAPPAGAGEPEAPKPARKGPVWPI